MIPEETIARVRESVDLVELVREHVQGLKKTGRNFVARCPFHQERTPSFSVNPEMGVFKCFGCGVGGDAFKFLMLLEGLSYPEAIRKLAARVGITIEETQREENSAEVQERVTLYGLLEDASRFYHRHFLESSEAKEARAYLLKRGVSEKTLETFQIGFAPASGNALREAAARKGWSVEILEKAGLLRRKEGSGRIFDHLWNRIIFPIWDSQGRIIAFGGRAMPACRPGRGDVMPKYINSPETPIYSKSRHLYGFFQALPSIRKLRHVIILEGYMDVAVCHQFGFDHGVATLGTALTDEHVRLLRRHCERVTLLFDPDNAGAQATLRGGELLLSEGVTVDVVTLPDELDPDELLIRDGAEALAGHLKNAVPFIRYCIQRSVPRHTVASPEGKLAIAKEVLPVIRRVRDPLLQDEYLAQLAEVLRVEKAVLGRQLKMLREDRSERESKSVAVTAAPKSGLLSVEEEILLLALLYPSAQVAEIVDTVAWRSPSCRTAWEALRASVVAGSAQVSRMLPGLSPEEQEWLTHLVLEARDYARPLYTLEILLESWQRQQAETALRDMQTEINAMIEGRVPLDAAKVHVFNELSRRLKGSVH